VVASEKIDESVRNIERNVGASPFPRRREFPPAFAANMQGATDRIEVAGAQARRRTSSPIAETDRKKQKTALAVVRAG
jgi:hypothetical protein